MLWLGECAPVGARRFEQAESAYDVGLDEVFWGADGVVYMAFCRKVQNGTRAVFSQQMGNELVIVMSPCTKVWRVSFCKLLRFGGYCLHR